MFRIKKIRAFTLIELLVVVTIIGILSVLVVVNLQDTRAKARNSQRKSDLNTIASALETYYSDYNGYPYGEGIKFHDDVYYPRIRNVGLSTNSYRINCSSVYPPGADRDACEDGAGWLWQLPQKGYIDKVPVDPFNLLGDEFIKFPVKLIGNPGTGQPGLLYIYFNDEPDYLACNYDWEHGYAQTYKLFTALERPDADTDWVSDGGAYPPPGTANTDPWSVDLLDIKINDVDVSLGGVEVGMMYEVYSAGGAQAFANLQGKVIILDDLRADECY
ncbi:MAG: prepilin-type N-terminal cleavage/methylation domain-containing protein [bacterium]